MEHPPGIMPAIPLRKRIAPFERIEGRLPAPVLVFPPHQLMKGIIQVFLVHRPGSIDLKLIRRTPERLTKPVDTEIIVRILQRPGCILIELYIIRHITQLVVIFDPSRPTTGIGPSWFASFSSAESNALISYPRTPCSQASATTDAELFPTITLRYP